MNECTLETVNQKLPQAVREVSFMNFEDLVDGSAKVPRLVVCGVLVVEVRLVGILLVGVLVVDGVDLTFDWD